MTKAEERLISRKHEERSQEWVYVREAGASSRAPKSAGMAGRRLKHGERRAGEANGRGDLVKGMAAATRKRG